MNNIPRIDVIRTGENISRFRKEKGYSVKEVQEVLGFNTPQAIFKWQRGECLPTVDNLVILAEIFGVQLNEILVITRGDG